MSYLAASPFSTPTFNQRHMRRGIQDGDAAIAAQRFQFGRGSRPGANITKEKAAHDSHLILCRHYTIRAVASALGRPLPSNGHVKGTQLVNNKLRPLFPAVAFRHRA